MRRWRSGGVLLVLVGVFLLLINLGVLPWDFRKLWPVILIVLGISELFDF